MMKMAKFVSAIGLSVVLLITIQNTKETAGYETYEVYSYLPYLDNVSLTRVRRQTQDIVKDVSTTQQATIFTSAPPPPTSPTLTTQSSSTKILENTKQIQNTTLTTTIVAQNDNLSSVVPPKIDNKKYRNLLGVNGTGQLKKDTLLNKPTAVVSEPINPINKNPKLLVAATTPQSISIKLNSDDTITIDDIDKFDIDTNKTLILNNLTKLEEDYHIYYNSTIIVDKTANEKYWDTVTNLTVSSLLSKSHRRAMTVQLSFTFPFYGHPVRNVTVATGGFLYMGDYVHSWLAATQYIAPLMANFDTSLSNESFVKFTDNGTVFTVLWENVTLQDRPEIGKFTFSASLYDTGDILFSYYSVPILIESIHDDKHPVKVGLSDAYIIDKTIFFARRKTIYEYHRVNFASQDIRNYTMIYLHALPTCIQSKDCQHCVTTNPSFKCSWCTSINRCSTGMDRKRQDWLQKGCDKIQITDHNLCPALGDSGNNQEQHESDLADIMGENDKWNSMKETTFDKDDKNYIPETSKIIIQQTQQQNEDSAGFGMIVGILFTIGLVMTAFVWIFYAYRNPHTKSGQLLIQYRPSQWTWKRGEARYTAATIHM